MILKKIYYTIFKCYYSSHNSALQINNKLGPMKYLTLFFIIFVNTANAGNLNDLKKRLDQDWGYELSLAPGPNGDGSKLSPIKINSSDPKEVSRTAFFTVQGLQKGMSDLHKSDGSVVTGMLWKVLDGLKYDNENDLYFLKVDRIILTQKEKISETATYYFSAPKLQEIIINTLQLPNSFENKNTYLNLPFEIGYLQNNQNKNVDYAQKHNRPDLGYSLAFDAIGIQATVYLYPALSELKPNSIRNEFEKAANEVTSISKQKLTEWIDDQDNDQLYVRYWKIETGLPRATSLWLFAHNGQFVKIRMTWDRDPTIDEIVFEFAYSLYQAL